jgi:GNAT superfamily N-acetyltransferase
MSLQLSAPESLAAGHKLSEFACGEVLLDDWLKRRALANHLSGASRTFVVADSNGQVFGYYSLASGAVAHPEATSAIRRNMPDPVPVMVLARLAVDQRAQGLKLGAALLRDAVGRARAVRTERGGSCRMVHALNDHAKQFYAHYGFQSSPIHPLTLMLRLTD